MSASRSRGIGLCHYFLPDTEPREVEGSAHATFATVSMPPYGGFSVAGNAGPLEGTVVGSIATITRHQDGCFKRNV